MYRTLLKTLTLIFLLVITICHIHSKEQIQQKISQTKMMYGATIRLRHVVSNYHLHSHRVNYPRSSGQQSVTGFPGDNDYNSLWTLKEANDDTVKTYYHEVRCGDTVRLQHALTKRNLHSEEIYQSMVSGGQQISVFGYQGNGDDNDNWVLRCVYKDQGEFFYGGDVFELVHENTEKRLKTSRYHEYSHMNWENCPFQGQLEVSGVGMHSRETEWRIVGGVFFKEPGQRFDDNENSEEEDL